MGQFLNKISKSLIILVLIFSFNFAYSENKNNNSQLNLDTLLELAIKSKESGKVLFNFEKIDLNLLTYFMSELTDKNIIVNTNLKGEASLVFNEPVSIKQAWDIYTAILKARNYNVIDKGNYVEIVSNKEVRDIVPPLNKPVGNSTKLMTYVYRLKNAKLSDVYRILVRLKRRGVIAPYYPANVVVITDTEDNIKTIKNILNFIDSIDSQSEIKIYKLKYINAKELTSALRNILIDYRNSFKIYPLNSLNTVLVKANQTIIEKIDKIVNELDSSPDDIYLRKFWIIKIKNSKSKDIAKVVNSLLKNAKILTKGKNLPTNSLGKLTVVSDDSSNSLVVFGNKVEYEAVKNLVEKLDKEKKQILITVLIAEVSQSALREIGIRWQIFGSNGGAAFRGGISRDNFFSLSGSANFVAGGVSSSGVNVNINGNTVLFPDLLFLFSLLEKGSGFNVVSSPKILVLDNSEAQINVSQVVPFATSIKYDVNGNPIINYDYKEVGLIMKTKPHISGNNIIIELHQEVNDVIGFENAQVGNLSYIVPKTSKRQLDTVITVENGKTIVLGGLVSKKTVKSMEGVPLLSQIPVIGNLFKYRSESSDKTNLFIFITPYIINKPEDIAKITEEHMKLVKKLHLYKKLDKGIMPNNSLSNSKDKTDNELEDYKKFFE
ncbi:MAG: type II secretion system protein GspD [Persephonella sp.]|nr:MAG: type II secretion system protein GspD [Persephonella sp.]